MTYVMSDIHGCYDKYMEMLKQINFESEDILYVLGDAIDRGPDGFKTLLDMSQRPNVFGLMGNHEAMAIDALSHLMNTAQGGRGKTLSNAAARAVELWFWNGGEYSLADFLALSEDQMQAVWKYMTDLPLYRSVEVGARKFLLVHGGLEGFSPTRPLEDYAPEDILWCRPQPDTVYYSDQYVIFGHTPVQLLGAGDASSNTPAKIHHNGLAIDIDCGCVFPDGRLACLCLDTMEEFYV